MTSETFCFPPETVPFLNDLKANNNREWFNAHKATYASALKQPAETFVDVLRPHLEQLAGETLKGKIYRIHRDVRFSKDKTPYKPHLHISFMPPSHGETPIGWFFALETDRLILGAGAFQFGKQDLVTWRDRVAGPDGAQLSTLIDDLRQSGARVSEPSLKRVPSGFDKDHPREALLRCKGFSVWQDIMDTGLAERPDLVPVIVAGFQTFRPVMGWLGQG